MHIPTSARQRCHANDNDVDVHKPPSITVGAAQTILIACTGDDVVLLKDAASAYPFQNSALATNCLGEMLPDDFRTSTGWHALVPVVGVPFHRNPIIADAIAGACVHPIMPAPVLDFPTPLLVRGATALAGIPANDLC